MGKTKRPKPIREWEYEDVWFDEDTNREAAKRELEAQAKKAYNGDMDEHIKSIRDNFYFKGKYPELTEVHSLLEYIHKLQRESISLAQRPQPLVE